MAYLEVSEQDALIRRDFPGFRLKAEVGWIGVWEGPVTPISRTYRIRIVYFRRKFFDGWTLENPYVSVQVINPSIGAEALSDGQILPHIYWNKRKPEFPHLCLYDPQEMTWTPEQSIAATIIPWTSEWLCFYEYWQITGDFRGPGRHPEPRGASCQTTQENSDPETRAQRARFRNAEFHRLGRKTGAFGSYLWMAGASEAFSLPPFLPDWSNDISAAAPSLPVLTLSPALQPAASSAWVWGPA
jgi:hypothetical protein